MQNHYDTLGVKSYTSTEGINRACNRLAHKYKEDTTGSSETKLKEMEEACQILTNHKKRAEYNSFLNNRETQSELPSKDAKIATEPIPRNVKQKPFDDTIQFLKTRFFSLSEFFAQGILGFAAAKIITYFIRSELPLLTFFTENFLGFVILFSAFIAILKLGQYFLELDHFKAVCYWVGVACFVFFMSDIIPGNIFLNGVSSPSDEKILPYPENFHFMEQTLNRNEILQLQSVLAKDADVYPEGFVTGVYGELTHRALIRYQKKHGLPAKGYYGEQTKALIMHSQ